MSRTSHRVLLGAVLLVACGQAPDGATLAAATAVSEEPSSGDAPPSVGEAAETTQPGDEAPVLYRDLLEPRDWTWEELFERRVIRALVVPNSTSFFFDKGRQRGITADAFVELEAFLNSRFAVGARRFHVAAIPVERERILEMLAEGRGEIAVANLTVTPEREERVDFTVPTSKPIDEVVVTGAGAPPLSSLDDLSGQRVYVRRSSSFWGSLEGLNESLAARGLAPVVLDAADENLETEDILEMVHVGLVPITVADSHVATFWADALPELQVHAGLRVHEARRVAWAVRKSATGLKEVLDPFVDANRQGTLLGNTLFKRYLQANRWVKNPAAQADRQRFLGMVEFFRRYGERYELDPIMVAAQGYQESGLDQSVRSPVGAVGVMQVMPSTAEDPAVDIPNIEELEPNIHAGTKYLRHLVDVYFDEPGIAPQDRVLFAFAGYNAGPNRINRLRKVATAEGLDGNRWFRNVELIVAREVGREPVQYVANIYKYYVAYSLVLAQPAEREAQSGRREDAKNAL